MQKYSKAALFLVLAVGSLYICSRAIDALFPEKCPWVWHGGSPSHAGSCWCGSDAYCMCTPSLAIDCIIEYIPEGMSVSDRGLEIVLVVRKDPPKDMFAIPGGFVSVGETVEEATIREVSNNDIIVFFIGRIQLLYVILVMCLLFLYAVFVTYAVCRMPLLLRRR
jgi:hypothetical protein